MASELPSHELILERFEPGDQWDPDGVLFGTVAGHEVAVRVLLNVDEWAGLEIGRAYRVSLDFERYGAVRVVGEASPGIGFERSPRGRLIGRVVELLDDDWVRLESFIVLDVDLATTPTIPRPAGLTVGHLLEVDGMLEGHLEDELAVEVCADASKSPP